MAGELVEYASLLEEIKGRIRDAQTRAILSANSEMLALYWEVGRLIRSRQEIEGWGAGVLKRLATDLKTELPGVKGFSERNLRRMTQFHRTYPDLFEIWPPAVAKLRGGEARSSKGPPAVAQLSDGESRSPKGPPAVALLTGAEDDDSHEELRQLVCRLPWAHNMLLLQKVKSLQTRRWYIQQALEHGWSRNFLGLMISSKAHQRQGEATTNFESRLPEPQSDLAQQALKDPYVFDFLTLDKPFRERELEAGLIAHLERFMLELGVGFAFVGRQHHLSVGDDDFYLDLLFYHLKLRCYVVIDLKIGAFKPDYAGKMNFYLNVVDDLLRHEHDKPSIGLILCQDKKKILAEYALRGVDKPIGVSEYELTRALPERLKSALPTIEEIEAELSETGKDDTHDSDS